MKTSSNAIQLLKDDHKTVTGLFRQFEAVDRRAHEMKSGVCNEIFMALEIHTQLEQNFFYPAVQEAATDETDNALISQCFEDHSRVSDLISELKSMSPNHETFDERFGELIDEVELHIKKEETDIFSTAQQLLASQLESLGQQMEAEKSRLLDLHEYSSTRPEIVQNPNGGEQKRIQKDVA